MEIATMDPATAILLGPEREACVYRDERAVDDEFEPEVREDVHHRSRHRNP